MALRKYFTEHPASVGETYFGHFRVAARFSRCLAKAAGAAAVHAVVPSLCATTASQCIRELSAEMNSGARGAAAAATTTGAAAPTVEAA